MNYDPLKKPKFNEQPDYSHQFCRGLVGWWMLNEPGGNTAHDLSPGGLNPGTLTNGPTWKDAALDFPGVDEYVDCGDADEFSFTDGGNDRPFSISAWVKADDLSAGNHSIISKHNTNQNEWYFALAGTDVYIRLYHFNDFNQRIGRAVSANRSTGVWYHTLCTYDGSETEAGIKIYIDGERLDDTSHTAGTYTGMTNAGASVLIGADYAGTLAYFDGLIDDVRIYNRTLPAAEANALFVNSVTGEYAEFPKLGVTKYFIPTTPANDLLLLHQINLRGGLQELRGGLM